MKKALSVIGIVITYFRDFRKSCIMNIIHRVDFYLLFFSYKSFINSCIKSFLESLLYPM